MGNEMLERLVVDIDAEIAVEEAWASNFRARYDVEGELFELKYSDKDKDEQNIRSIWQLDPDARDALKEEADRLWGKIEELIKQRQEEGGPGIYDVSISWNRIAWLAAEDKESAERQAETLFGWLCEIKTPQNPRLSSLRVTLMYDYSQEILNKKNKELASITTTGIDEAKKRIISEQKRLRWLTAVSAILPPTGSE